MDTARTTAWGAERYAGARRLARALTALERRTEVDARWADATEAVRPSEHAWADGAQSGCADAAAQLAELVRCLGDETAELHQARALLASVRAWMQAELDESRADAAGEVDLERRHALGRAAALALVLARLDALLRRREQP